MGQDFGQEREWSEERELDWSLLGEKLNLGLHHYVRDLLKLYRKYPCMYERDNSWAGFEWMNADDGDHSTYSFIRKSENGRNNLLFIINMTPMSWDNYQVPVPKKKKYKLVLNSDDFEYGGNGNLIPEELTAEKVKCANQEYAVTLHLPAYAAVIYAF